MLLGILSDSHNHVAPVQRALALFDKFGVDTIVHCGDVGTEDVFAEFTGRRFRFVWGNTDVLTSSLAAFLSTAGIAAPGDPPLHWTIDGKRFALFHGHEPDFYRAPESLDVDYILHGHTHLARDEMVNGRRLINPGALHRAREKTVATLDVAGGLLQFHVV